MPETSIILFLRDFFQLQNKFHRYHDIFQALEEYPDAKSVLEAQGRDR